MLLAVVKDDYTEINTSFSYYFGHLMNNLRGSLTNYLMELINASEAEIVDQLVEQFDSRYLQICNNSKQGHSNIQGNKHSK